MKTTVSTTKRERPTAASIQSLHQQIAHLKGWLEDEQRLRKEFEDKTMEVVKQLTDAREEQRRAQLNRNILVQDFEEMRAAYEQLRQSFGLLYEGAAMRHENMAVRRADRWQSRDVVGTENQMLSMVDEARSRP